MEKIVKFNSQIRQILSLLNQEEIKNFCDMRVKSANTGPSSAKVSIITPTNKMIYLKNIFSNYSTQQFINKELIIILNNNALNINDWKEYGAKYPNVSVFQLDETLTTGECLNFAVQQANGSYIARFDDDDYYGPNYLSDMLYYFRTTKASLLGKLAHFLYFEKYKQLAVCHVGKSHKYTHSLPGGTFVFKREVFQKVQFRHCCNDEDDYFNDDCRHAGFSLYSTDSFNFIQIRRADKTYHTWTIEDKRLLKSCQPLIKTDNPIPFVMV